MANCDGNSITRLGERTIKYDLYIGSVEGYHGRVISRNEVINSIIDFQQSCKNDRKDWCSLTISDTTYVVGGADYIEQGYVISAINYPRFPKSQDIIEEFMYELAKYLLVRLKQNRITVVGPHSTSLFTRDNAEESP